MGVGAGLYMYVVVVHKSSRSLSHLLMSSCFSYGTEENPVVIDWQNEACGET